MSQFLTYLSLFLLTGACAFNTGNNLSDDSEDNLSDGGPVAQVDAPSGGNDGPVVMPDATLAPDGPIAPPPDCDPNNSDLVLCMTFDGLSPNATTVPDLSGNNHVATFDNGTIAEGKDGQGLQTQAQFTSTITATQALDNAKTIEMWVRPNGLSRNFQGLFEGNGFYLYIIKDGLLGCEANGIDNSKGTSKDPVITAAQWQHVACVLNDSGAKLFVNGVEIEERIRGVEDFVNNDPNQYTFGRRSLSWGAGVRLEGKMDTLRIWSTDRSGQICPECLVDTP